MNKLSKIFFCVLLIGCSKTAFANTVVLDVTHYPYCQMDRTTQSCIFNGKVYANIADTLEIRCPKVNLPDWIFDYGSPSADDIPLNEFQLSDNGYKSVTILKSANPFVKVDCEYEYGPGRHFRK